MTGWTIYDWAKFYVSHGLSVIPLRPGGTADAKAPAIGAWEPYKTRVATDEELRLWFYGKTPQQVGIAIVAGPSNLRAIDIDDVKLWPFFFKDAPDLTANNTWVNKTRHGYHVLFVVKGNFENVELKGWAELKAFAKYIVAPPSIHPEGTAYEWLKDARLVKIAELETSVLSDGFIPKISFLATYAKTIEAMIPVYTEGNRHETALFLAGALRKLKISLDDAKQFIRLLCLLTEDPEENDRMKAVNDTYEADIGDIAGFSKVKNILEKSLGSKFTIAMDLLGSLGSGRGEMELSDKMVTDVILSKYMFCCEQNDPNQTLYVFSGGRWTSGMGENIILNSLANIYKDQEDRRRMGYERTVGFIKGLAMDRAIKEPPAHHILFKNGVYDLMESQLQPHNPSFFYVNQIPHDYVPAADCPEWRKWLSEVIRPEDIAFMQEWFGYCLLSEIGEAAFLILTGSGQNGKTIFMDILALLLGADNITNVTLAALTYDTFAPAELYHKLANLSDDIGNETIRNAGRLKEVSSGSQITAQRKFGHPFNFKPYAKIIYSCNEPPEIKDESDALKFRMKVVEFPYTFAKNPMPGQKPAKDRKGLMEQLTAEMPGILNWALEGLKRFLTNGSRFSFSKSTEEVWRFYQRRSKPVVSFITECLEITENEEDLMSKEEVWKFFKSWITNQRISRDVSRDKFFKDMKDQGLESRQIRDRNMMRFYIGIKTISQSTICNKVTTTRVSNVQQIEKYISTEDSYGNKDIEQPVTLLQIPIGADITDIGDPFMDTCHYCKKQVPIIACANGQPACAKCINKKGDEPAPYSGLITTIRNNGGKYNLEEFCQIVMKSGVKESPQVILKKLSAQGIVSVLGDNIIVT